MVIQENTAKLNNTAFELGGRDKDEDSQQYLQIGPAIMHSNYNYRISTAPGAPTLNHNNTLTLEKIASSQISGG